MKKIVAFGGLIQTVTPGSLVEWYALPQHPRSVDAGTDRVVCFVGRATGGVPLKPYVFTDTDVASRVLGQGELLTATLRALTQNPRPRAVVAVNVTGGTPASYALKDKDGGVVATLKTRTFREIANQTTVSVSGDPAKGLRVEVVDAMTGAKVMSNRVGLGVYITYTGKGSAATVAITESAGQKVLETSVTGAPGDSLKIPLAGHTMQSLARRVQELGPYTVMLARDARLAATALDLTSARDISAYPLFTTLSEAAAQGATSLTVSAIPRAATVGDVLRVRNGVQTVPVRVTEAAAQGATTLKIERLSQSLATGASVFEPVSNPMVPLTATKGDLLQFFNTYASGVVEVEDGPSDLAPVTQKGFFEGGVSLYDGATDWEDALTNALAETPFGCFTALTDERALVFGLRAKLISERRPDKGKWVQMFDGVGESFLPDSSDSSSIEMLLQDVTSEVAGINDHDTVFVAQSLDMVDPQTGAMKRQPPYMVAAQVAAMRAGIGIGESLTYRQIGGTNPFPDVAKDRRDEFTLAGALIFEAPRRGQQARIVRGRTAYVGEDNTIYESEKQVAIMNAIARDVRAIQDAIVPGAGTPARIGEYKSRLEDYYESKTSCEPAWIQPGIDENGRSVPAYEYSVGRTTDYGQRLVTKSVVNPVGEIIVGEHRIGARAVEIES